MAAIVIGKPGDVAIELQLDTSVSAEHRRWLFGTIAFWFAGYRVGNADEINALTTVHVALRELAKFAGHRRDDALAAMPADQAFATIHGALYDADIDTLTYAEIRSLAERNERFHALPACEAFDGWNAYLVETDSIGRILVRGPDMPLLDLSVTTGTLDAVIAASIVELDKLAASA